LSSRIIGSSFSARRVFIFYSNSIISNKYLIVNSFCEFIFKIFKKI